MTEINATSPTPATGHAARPPVRGRLLLGLALVILLGFVLSVAGVAGYQSGQEQRQTSFEATRTYQLENQYALGLSDLEAGNYEVAAARFEYVLELDPNYRDALARLNEAQAGLGATPIPRLTLAVATPTLAVSPLPTESGEAASLLAQAHARAAAEDWDGVISALTHLHSVDPNYQPVRADGLLFRALRNRGVARIMGDAMEAGIFDLDQAEAFGPLDNEAANVRTWARTYLAGRSYWGLDWKRTMEIFEELSLVAPYFRDTDRRLFEAVVNYADQLVAAGDYCAAAERYQRALLLFADDTVSTRLTTAQASCANPPPPTAEGSEAAGDGTVTPPVEGTPAP